MLKRTILIILLSLSAYCLQAQIIKTKLDIVTGLGIPEYLHAGLRYQYNEFAQIGVYYGDDTNLQPEYITTITGEHMFHFGEYNYTSNRPVWYARTGLTWSKFTNERKHYYYTYIDLGAGRDFPINSRLGVNYDMGFSCQVREKTVDKAHPDEPKFLTKAFWRGMVRLQLYYSF